ncbi:MAG: LysR substrate-binding domain-containing protein [Pseudomonadota bacterium]
MDQLRALKYFAKVVETGSFTQAAQSFSVPASSVSRRIADLERSLGASLLKRSTRVVKITEIGQLYYEQINDILVRLEQSDELVQHYQSEPIGQLRISSMVGFGERILLPLMEEFSQRYPKVVLDISLSDELSTLARDDVDLAIRGGYAPNERVQALKLMNNDFIVVAAPSYLQKHGTPTEPDHLSQHRGLYFRSPAGPLPWLCQVDEQWREVTAPAAGISNEGKWLVQQAIDGQGILMMPNWGLQGFIDSGELIQLHIQPELRITTNTDLGVYLLYQKHRYLVPKIKVAVDFLVARVREMGF